MHPLLERIAAGEVIVCDGAMGTMIQSGPGYEKCPEEINLSSPEILTGIARAFIEAGAEIVCTNTFGASPIKLAAAGLEARTEEINAVAVRAARAAAGDRALVAASCGPSGKLLITGEVTPQALEAGFTRQMTALVEAGTDLIIIETMTDLVEAMIAVRAARNLDPDLPVVATMTFDPTPQGFRTIMGVAVEDAGTQLRTAGADLVGSNCGYGMATMVEIAREFRRTTDAPLIIQPNAGLPVLGDDGVVYPETPASFAARVPDLLEAGVAIIGGCCGSTPDHIRAIRQAVDERRTAS